MMASTRRSSGSVARLFEVTLVGAQGKPDLKLPALHAESELERIETSAKKAGYSGLRKTHVEKL